MVNNLNEDNILVHSYNQFRDREFLSITWQETGHHLLNLSRYVVPFVFGAGSMIKREHYESVGGFEDISRWEYVELGIAATLMYPGKIFSSRGQG